MWQNRHPHFSKLFHCPIVGGFSKCLCTGSLGVNEEFVRKTCFVNHVLEYKVCDGAAADVAMADKKYFCHKIFSSQNAKICREMRGFIRFSAHSKFSSVNYITGISSQILAFQLCYSSNNQFAISTI